MTKACLSEAHVAYFSRVPRPAGWRPHSASPIHGKLHSKVYLVFRYLSHSLGAGTNGVSTMPSYLLVRVAILYPSQSEGTAIEGT